MWKNENVWYRAPRILAILFIVFLTLFSFDVFESGGTTGEIALAFLMHNIPSITVAVLLAIAWRHDLWGQSYF